MQRHIHNCIHSCNEACVLFPSPEPGRCPRSGRPPHLEDGAALDGVWVGTPPVLQGTRPAQLLNTRIPTAVERLRGNVLCRREDPRSEVVACPFPNWILQYVVFSLSAYPNVVVVPHVGLRARHKRHVDYSGREERMAAVPKA